VRWPIAAAILTFGIVGTLGHWFETCAEEADAGKTVLACRDPSVSDASVVFMGVMFLLLIAPDFDEAGLFGFALKRRIQHQEERQVQLERQLTVVSSRLEAVATANASASATINLQLSESLLRQARAGIEQKHRDFEKLVRVTRPVAAASEPTERDGQPSTAVSDTDADLRAELLRLAEELNRLVFQGEYSGHSTRDLEWALAQNDLKSRFTTLFADELEVVRVARNAVAHAQPLDHKVLVGTADVARELVRLARQALR
jgi:hypothetical protein